MDDIRAYEKNMHEETNKKVAANELAVSDPNSPTTPSNTPTEVSLEEQMQKATVQDSGDNNS